MAIKKYIHFGAKCQLLFSCFLKWPERCKSRAQSQRAFNITTAVALNGYCMALTITKKNPTAHLCTHWIGKTCRSFVMRSWSTVISRCGFSILIAFGIFSCYLFFLTFVCFPPCNTFCGVDQDQHNLCLYGHSSFGRGCTLMVFSLLKKFATVHHGCTKTQFKFYRCLKILECSWDLYWMVLDTLVASKLIRHHLQN